MTTLRMTNGLLVRVRAYRRGDDVHVLADAIRGARTDQHDLAYRNAIERFESAWRAGVRGEELRAPETGAEVFMAGLCCVPIASVRPVEVPFPSRWIGGTGTEWRVRWRIPDREGRRFRVGESTEDAVVVSAVTFPASRDSARRWSAVRPRPHPEATSSRAQRRRTPPTSPRG